MRNRRLALLLALTCLAAITGTGELLHGQLHDHGADAGAIERCQVHYLLTAAAAAIVVGIFLQTLGESASYRPRCATPFLPPHDPLPSISPRAPPSY